MPSNEIFKVVNQNRVYIFQLNKNSITAYKNIAEVYVEKGERISALQKIGKVFNPKDGSKSTLQFSIFNNTKAIDPYLWIVK